MITARYNRIYTGGYDGEEEDVKTLITPDIDYDVANIVMSQSYTSVYLKKFPKVCFNSIFFDFYEDGVPINIFKDKRFNTYL